MKNILVIGGSYFTGRVYMFSAVKEGDVKLHVLNRGRFPLKLDGVKEYHCDRHDEAKMSFLLRNEHFDAVIDFCGYAPGDIATVIRALEGRIGHYIFFSTASICVPSEKAVGEDAPLLSEWSSGELGAYLRGKKELEEELVSTCSEKIPWTILRPSFLYGPYNYAPRESWLIQQIVKGVPIPYPVDASGRWSFVYVKDVACALRKIAGNPVAFREIYHLASPEVTDYPTLFQSLEQACKKAFPTCEMTCSQVEAERIELPFPLYESLCYDGSKLSKNIGIDYTPLKVGMEETYRAFLPVLE